MPCGFVWNLAPVTPTKSGRVHAHPSPLPDLPHAEHSRNQRPDYEAGGFGVGGDDHWHDKAGRKSAVVVTSGARRLKVGPINTLNEKPKPSPVDEEKSKVFVLSNTESCHD
jgi:hypothetical protein